MHVHVHAANSLNSKGADGGQAGARRAAAGAARGAETRWAPSGVYQVRGVENGGAASTRLHEDLLLGTAPDMLTCVGARPGSHGA